MTKIVFWAFCLFWIVPAASGHAFQLGTHAWITEQAIQEFNACHPGLFGETSKIINSDDARTVTLSNQEEDVNLFRKWLEFSHYYNPYKKLDMRRKDSGDRMSDLEQALAADLAQGDRHTFTILAHLGHVLHHVQDMASPPHVVPVAHDMSDGFESLEIDGQSVEPVAAPSALDCNAQKTTAARNGMPLELLRQTAIATLQALEGSGRVPSAIGIDENLYWAAPAKPLSVFDVFSPSVLDDTAQAFGSYGVYGNHFGDTEFVDQRGLTQKVSRRIYLAIWARQLRLAIDSSRLAIEKYWQLKAL